MTDVLQRHEGKTQEKVESNMARVSRQQFEELAKTPSKNLEQQNTAQHVLPNLQIDMGGESTTKNPQPQNVETTAPQTRTQRNP